MVLHIGLQPLASMKRSHQAQCLTAHSDPSLLPCVQPDHRLPCSGTPVNTDVKDLSGHFAALHMDPLHTTNFQHAHLRNGLAAFSSSVLFLLSTLMIRHSKAAVERSRSMSLPTTVEEIIEVTYTAPEWKIYRQAFQAVRAEFDTYAALSAMCARTHSLSMMALLMQLRRLCSGGPFAPAALQSALMHLKSHVRASAASDASALAAGAQSTHPLFPQEDELECPICMDDFENPLCTPVATDSAPSAFTRCCSSA
jgi:hypothetical protein